MPYYDEQFRLAADAYETLGVAADADLTTIKRAFRKFALLFHPDKNPGKEEQFKEVNNAYEILSDTAKRRDYDDARNAAKNNFSGERQKTSHFPTPPPASYAREHVKRDPFRDAYFGNNGKTSKENQQAQNDYLNKMKDLARNSPKEFIKQLEADEISRFFLNRHLKDILLFAPEVAKYFYDNDTWLGEPSTIERLTAVIGAGFAKNTLEAILHLLRFKPTVLKCYDFRPTSTSKLIAEFDAYLSTLSTDELSALIRPLIDINNYRSFSYFQFVLE